MTTLKETKYTLVQHSGFGYSDKPGFKQGLEVRSLTTVGDLRKVEKAGGIVLDSYSEADDLAEKLAYPEGTGLYPAAKGTFSEEKIDYLRIYQPVREVTG